MKRASLTKHVYNRLIDKFYAREYRPGDLIDRRRVADEVGVSVGTVLIAVNQLEADGFVETLPRKGTLVRSVGFQEVLGQLLTREAFECQAARLYCGRPVEESLERLLPMARELDRVKDFDSQSIHLDGVFHTELIKLTRQPVFIDNYSKVNKLSSFFSFLYFSPGFVQVERDSHVQLLQRLQTTDRDEAERAIRRHIRWGRPFLFADASADVAGDRALNATSAAVGSPH
jgi:GntR family transcriptional regulator, rspAB operon transcriptional repressor